MHRCKHAYEIKFHPFSGIRAECTLCQDIVRLRKRYAAIGYSIGFIICSFLLMLFEHLIVSSWLILPLIPSLLLVYVFMSWLMYTFIKKACQRGSKLSDYFRIAKK